MSKPIENTILQKTPEPAEWLSPDGKKHFRYIVPLLIKDKVICSVDVPTIEAACDLYAFFQDCGNKLADRKSALASYVSIMSAFGVTYKARKALAIMKSQDKDDDPTFGGLFDGQE